MLKLDGKKIELDRSGASRVARHLRDCPDDELYTGSELSHRLGISHDTFKNFSARLSVCRARLGVQYLYGSPKALAAFRRQLEAQRNSPTR